MTPEQKAHYLHKSGDEEIITTNLIENEHGFASFARQGEKLIIYNVYGDGPYWDRFFVALARRNGCKKLVIGTRRSPKAYERKFGYTVIGHILEKEV